MTWSVDASWQCLTRMRHSTFWSTKGLETTIPGAEMVKWTDEELSVIAAAQTTSITQDRWLQERAHRKV